MAHFVAKKLCPQSF